MRVSARARGASPSPRAKLDEGECARGPDALLAGASGPRPVHSRGSARHHREGNVRRDRLPPRRQHGRGRARRRSHCTSPTVGDGSLAPRARCEAVRPQREPRSPGGMAPRLAGRHPHRSGSSRVGRTGRRVRHLATEEGAQEEVQALAELAPLSPLKIHNRRLLSRKSLASGTATTASARGGRKAAMAFIYVTIILDTLGFGITIPVLPRLIVSLSPDTASGVEIFGLFVTIWSLMQFLFAPFIGVLSDRYGRRPVLILSGFGLGVDYMIMALAPNLAWLLLGRILSGITASSYATAAAFGMVGAAWGLGFILGPGIGGLIGGLGARLPFWFAAAFSLTSAAYGLFVLPESLPRGTRQPFAWRRANPAGSLKLLRSHRDLFGLAAVNFVQFLGFQVLPSVFVLYAGYRYGWGPVEVGLSLTVVGALNITVQGGLVKRFIKRFGERKALITGLVAGTASFIVWGLASTPALFVLAIVVFAPIGFAQPSIQSLMTRRVRPSEQGQLQGANASIAGLTGILGPLLFTFIFAFFISPSAPVALPGMPFFVAAALMLASAFLAVRVTSGSAGAPAAGPTVAVPDGAGPKPVDPVTDTGDPNE